VPVKLAANVQPDTVWTWNAIGKRRGAWKLSPDAPEGNRGFLLNHLISDRTPRADYADFRDELRLENYPGQKLVYTINVKNFDESAWTRIGEMELTDYSISEGGDRRLHFWIPRDVPSPRWDSGG